MMKLAVWTHRNTSTAGLQTVVSCTEIHAKHTVFLMSFSSADEVIFVSVYVFVCLLEK